MRQIVHAQKDGQARIAQPARPATTVRYLIVHIIARHEHLVLDADGALGLAFVNVCMERVARSVRNARAETTATLLAL
jgi:hypothetical protein